LGFNQSRKLPPANQIGAFPKHYRTNGILHMASNHSPTLGRTRLAPP
jgi:hypothetical protein